MNPKEAMIRISQAIKEIAELMASEYDGALEGFLEGNAGDDFTQQIENRFNEIYSNLVDDLGIEDPLGGMLWGVMDDVIDLDTSGYLERDDFIRELSNRLRHRWISHEGQIRYPLSAVVQTYTPPQPTAEDQENERRRQELVEGWNYNKSLRVKYKSFKRYYY